MAEHASPQILGPPALRLLILMASNLELGRHKEGNGRKQQARPVQTRAAASSFPLEVSQERLPFSLTYPAGLEGGGTRPGGAAGLGGHCLAQRPPEEPAGWSSGREHQVAAGREAGPHESFMTGWRVAEGLERSNAQTGVTWGIWLLLVSLLSTGDFPRLGAT